MHTPSLLVATVATFLATALAEGVPAADVSQITEGEAPATYFDFPSVAASGEEGSAAVVGAFCTYCSEESNEMYQAFCGFFSQAMCGQPQYEDLPFCSQCLPTDGGISILETPAQLAEISTTTCLKAAQAYHSSSDMCSSSSDDVAASSSSSSSDDGPVRPSYTWQIQNPSECSSRKCGESGTYTVEVVCVRPSRASYLTGKVVADSKCNPDTKPETEHACNIGPCEPGFTSVPGPWSSCSKTCGDGFQTRERGCVSEAGQGYVPHRQCGREYYTPSVNQLCNLGECGDEEYYLEYDRWEEQCSQECAKFGTVGTTTRTAKCFKMIGGVKPTRSIPLEECEKNGVRAELTKPCNRFAYCIARGRDADDNTGFLGETGATTAAGVGGIAAVSLAVVGVALRRHMRKEAGGRAKLMEEQEAGGGVKMRTGEFPEFAGIQEEVPIPGAEQL